MSVPVDTTTPRQAFIASLRAADCSWDKAVLVALAHTAANEIERLTEMAGDLQAQLQGAIDNSFYDQRDAYFDGKEEGRR